MIQRQEVLRLLRENHLKLSPDDQHMLLCRAAGQRSEEIASEMYRDPRTIRAHLERIEDLICFPAGLERREAMVTGVWVALHLSCEKGCLRAGLEAGQP